MKHIVCFHLYNDYSGSPKVLQMVLEGLLQRGYSVDLVTSGGGEGALDSLDGMQGFRKSTYFYRFNRKSLLLTALNYLWVQIYIFFYALRYAFRSDVVFYVNTIMPWSAALAGRMTAKRVVYHYHENAFAMGLHYRFNAWIMSRLAHEIMCVSAYQASFLSRKEGVTIIPNALPGQFLQRLHADAEAAFRRRNVLMLSSLKEYKGTREFIRIASDMPRFLFTLVINDSRENIDRYLYENAITCPRNLTIHPRQTDVAAFYNEASLVVNLTDRRKAIETFGLTVLEAMSAGVPVIVPTEGGIAELVDGRNGYKIDVGQLLEIERAIERMLSDRALYSELSRNSLDKAKEYDIEAVVSRVESILNSR